MPSFEITLKDRTIEQVAGAHAYQQEGQMTTFFRNDEPRDVVDSWSSRIFSVRTSEVLMIRRLGDDTLDRVVAGRPAGGRGTGTLWAVEA